MNERIKELAEQACFRSDVTVSDGQGDHIITKTEERLEKFAKLIVQECILTIQKGITRDGNNTEKYLRSMEHIMQIKNHFGVE